MLSETTQIMIKEYFQDNTILDARFDGKFKTNNKIFTDLKELLELSKYSEAKVPMKEIELYQDYVLKIYRG